MAIYLMTGEKLYQKEKLNLGQIRIYVQNIFKKNEVLWAWTTGAGESQISVLIIA